MQKNNEYLFSISDKGISMEIQYTDRIFEVFRRLHAIDEYKGGDWLIYCKENYRSS